MSSSLHFLAIFLLVLPLLHSPAFGLNTDGVLLLSFKYSIISDPLLVLENWNYDDATPCSWKGVTCTEIGPPATPDMFRVTSLVLPNSHLLGSISPDLGNVEHLRNLDLSNNFLNGSLPTTFFNATELRVVSLSGNEISGELPESVGGMRSLQLLNLTDNALAGKVPEKLTTLQNLTILSLRSNYFSGYVPGGFDSVQVLDLSSNLLNGSLPLDFGGANLHYLNLSYNKLTGPISQGFAKKIPGNVTVDLSFNNLTGAIPESQSLLNQKTESFRGNLELCGKPLTNLCAIPSTLSTPPNVSTTSPAIAVIPKPLDSTPSSSSSSNSAQNSSQTQSKSGLKPATIAAIAVSDLAGITLLALIILYVYQLKKRKQTTLSLITTTQTNPPKTLQKFPSETILVKSEKQQNKPTSCSSCLTIKGAETSEPTTSDSEPDDNNQKNEDTHMQYSTQNENQKGGKLVIVDGETELETETLLKASAFILGASGSSIVYKAVLGDGTALAVRRIGESGVERFRDFENQVRLIAKIRHPNLVKVRGFYWGNDEKLVIYDFLSNGSLAASSCRKPGSSPCHLPVEVRFRIARGVARGLAYIHEKKQTHGNVKPSNILLTNDMEPIISDFGLDRLILGNNSNKASSSGRNLGSQGLDQPINSAHNPSASSSPYQAPESLNNPKPNPKWDVYSFGIVLLELLTGRVFSDRDQLSQWTAGSMEDKSSVLRMADVSIRGDVEGREDAMVACLKLGFSCASFVPQKRPNMKEALQVLEKIPSTNNVSS